MTSGHLSCVIICHRHVYYTSGHVRSMKLFTRHAWQLLKIRWYDRVLNEEVLQQTGQTFFYCADTLFSLGMWLSSMKIQCKQGSLSQRQCITQSTSWLLVVMPLLVFHRTTDSINSETTLIMPHGDIICHRQCDVTAWLPSLAKWLLHYITLWGAFKMFVAWCR